MPRPRKLSNQHAPIPVGQIAKNIIQLRKERGLTQTQLAEAMGISRNLLSNYELGRTHLTDESIIKLAEVLKVSADDILGLSHPKTISDEVPSIRFIRRIQRISKLPSADQKAILKNIDMFLKAAESDS